MSSEFSERAAIRKWADWLVDVAGIELTITSSGFVTLSNRAHEKSSHPRKLCSDNSIALGAHGLGAQGSVCPSCCEVGLNTESVVDGGV